MKLLRDVSRMKPLSMVVLGEVVAPETIDSIYVSRRDCEAMYITSLLRTTQRYAKFRVQDIMRRVEWAFTAPKREFRLLCARDVIMWFNLFKPTRGTKIGHWIDLDRLNALTSYAEDDDTLIEASMYALRTPCLSTYKSIKDPVKKNAYFEWAVFMAMTGDTVEIMPYATRQFSHAA